MSIATIFLTIKTKIYTNDTNNKIVDNTNENVDTAKTDVVNNDDLKETDELTVVPTDKTDKISTTTEDDKKLDEDVNKEVVSNNIKSDTNNSYSDEDLYVLSHVIYAEAGGCSWEHQIAVGSVVLNRVKDERYPNTIKKVVFQKGQYACTWDGNYYKTPSKKSIEVATYLLKNGSQLPKYIIFQSTFPQGDSIYKKIDNTYFCYWSKDAK